MGRKKIYGYLAVVLVAALCGVSTSNLRAQTTYGAIVGTARDASSAIVPQVLVTVLNQDTGVAVSQSTNELGGYAFTTLYPGTYAIHAEMKGFRAIDIKGVQLQVNQTARFDLTMELGQVAEKIEVTAATAILATDSSDVGQVINNRQIVDMPLNGRNFIQLATLSSGVLLENSQEGVGGPMIASSMGGRDVQNSVLIEGVETRVQRRGSYGVNLSVEAIGEFKVMQNSFAAEYGRGVAVINTSIKGGTNEIHGSVYEFLRNNKLDARNFFDQTGITPPLRQNQFGTSAGGPIRKDKAFYFLNYEGQRVRNASTRLTNVPLPKNFDGDLSGMAAATDPLTKLPFPNNQVPADRISQYAKAARKYYPAPTGSSVPNINFAVVRPNPTTMDQGTARLDYILSPKDRLAGTTTFYHINSTNIGTLPFNGQASDLQAGAISAEHTHNFSPTMLNDFRFGFYRSIIATTPDAILDHPVVADYGLKNLNPEPYAYHPPLTQIQGFGDSGALINMPTGPTDENRQFVEQFTYIHGRHAIKAGGDLRFLLWDDLGYASQNGRYTFTTGYTRNSMADFLLGWPQAAICTQRTPGASYGYGIRNNEYSFYIQDDLKVTRGLTVNAGIRYEYVQWPKEVHNELTNWNFAKGTMDFAGKDIPDRVLPPDRNNWGPRLGFAYSPGFLKRTVIRAGSGVMYSNVRQYEIAILHYNLPFVYQNQLSNDVGTPSFTTATLWPAPIQGLQNVDFRNAQVNWWKDRALPVTYQWNFNIQHEISPNLLLEVGYAGNRGLRLPLRYDANQAVQDADPARPTPIQSRRPYQQAGLVTSVSSRSWSNYNSLIVHAERRFATGLAFLATYTWSKAMALAAIDNSYVQNSGNFRRNYGPLNNYTHRAVVSYVYELPFGAGKPLLGSARGALGQLVSGWQLNGITTVSSGAALTPSSSVSNGTGNSAATNLPNRIANGNLDSSQLTIQRWFDTAAFRAPTAGTWGNCGTGVLRGPGAVNWDVSFFKKFRVTERKALEFRWEMFNAFNHVNLGNPSVAVATPTFGAITSAATARQIQAGLKFLF